VTEVKKYVPGVLLSVLLGALAMAITHVSGLPVMMMALLLGLCVHNFCVGVTSLKSGIDWSSRGLLYIGVALLGLRIDVSDLAQAGFSAAAFVLFTLVATIAFGFFIARSFGENRQFGFLMGGAVAICGVSAAAAICSAMEDCETRDRELTITIAGITGLSTIAMILYPIIVHNLSLTTAEAGLFLGGTIHNVSQAVGAGYSISPEAGDVTVIFKLLRVAALLPIIANMQNPSLAAKVRSYFPPFLVAFIFLAFLNCLQLVPEPVTLAGNEAAKWCLIISLAAIGIKTNLREVFTHGKKPLIAMTLTTAFMAGFVLLGIYAAPWF